MEECALPQVADGEAMRFHDVATQPLSRNAPVSNTRGSSLASRLARRLAVAAVWLAVGVDGAACGQTADAAALPISRIFSPASVYTPAGAACTRASARSRNRGV